jgi:hypothetical protein
MGHIDRTKVSFAEAEKRPRFPAILKWGEIDQRLRSALWTPVFLFLEDHFQYDQYTDGPGYFLKEPAGSIMTREFVHRRHRFISDYKQNFYKDEYIETWSTFFKKSDYVDLLDFLTFVVRDPDRPSSLINRIARAMDLPFSPYRLSVEAKTIFPAVSDEETKSLERDLEVAFSSTFLGSKSHLQSALQTLGEGEYRTSVRESIHAVESAVKDFTGDPHTTLSKAIKSLVSETGIHKALADAFDKLYAYTSDEKGIRHALIFGDNERVGFDEAMFFLSACTAFVSFLSRKKNSKT